MKKKFTIPLYGCDFWLVVDDDLKARRNEMKELFGPSDDGDYGAVTYYSNRGHFAIFLEPKLCDLPIIVHEVFHVAHRISDWATLNFDEHHHEATAQICGYIFGLIERNTRDFRTAKDRAEKSRRRRARPEIVYGKRARKTAPHTKHRPQRNGGAVPIPPDRSVP